MPSTYAHYRFGQQTISELPHQTADRINRNRFLFMTGLHGPDILFYYRPLSSNRVNRLGYDLHNWKGSDFFNRAFQTARLNNQLEESLPYLAGFLCHFVLDSFCHPYIEEKIKKDHVGHAAVESSFDRFLMITDGLNPVTHRLTDHIVPLRENAEIISLFFPSVSPSEVFRAMDSFIFYNNLLTTESELKRKIIATAMKTSGHSEMCGMFIPKSPDPHCADSDRILFDLYHRAVDAIGEMMPELTRCLESGSNIPTEDKRFDHTFEAE